jgi:hypothetical protein
MNQKKKAKTVRFMEQDAPKGKKMKRLNKGANI